MEIYSCFSETKLPIFTSTQENTGVLRTCFLLIKGNRKYRPIPFPFLLICLFIAFCSSGEICHLGHYFIQDNKFCSKYHALPMQYIVRQFPTLWYVPGNMVGTRTLQWAQVSIQNIMNSLMSNGKWSASYHNTLDIQSTAWTCPLKLYYHIWRHFDAEMLHENILQHLIKYICAWLCNWNILQFSS